MDCTGTQFAERRPVLGGAVALVPGESIAWKAEVTLSHEPVAEDLGHDGGRRDGKDQGIAVRQTVLRQRDGRQMKMVDQQGFSRGLQPLQRPVHGLARGSHDANLIDDVGRYDAHSPGQCVLVDPREQLHAAGGRELLGVAHSREVDAKIRVVAGEDHGGGHDRTCPGPPPGFIQAGYGSKPLRPEAQFKVQAWEGLPIRQRCRLSLFPQAGGFALALAQEVEFRPAHMAVAQHLDLFDARRVRREGPLDAHAVSRNSPDRELGVGSPAAADANHRAPHELDTLPVTLYDAEVHLHVISHAQMGAIGLEPNIVLRLLFFD